MNSPFSQHSDSLPPRIVREDEIVDLLPRLNVQDTLRNMFKALGQGDAIQPPQSIALFPENSGDFITYLGAIADAGVFGAKLSPYIVTEGKPIVTAWTSLMSMSTGQPLLWCDASLLTAERTAATTALAIDYLAPAQSKRLAVIGSGNIAAAHIRHVAELRQWESIRVYSPSLKDDLNKQSQLKALDNRVVAVDSTENCTDQAEVIMLCTSSGTPVISTDNISNSALITSISTNVANAHEVPPSLITEADVYCDYKLTTPASAGEMCLAEEQYGWSPESLCGDLADLANERCKLPDYQKPIFFRSIGLGLEDIAIAYELWKIISTQDR